MVLGMNRSATQHYSVACTVVSIQTVPQHGEFAMPVKPLTDLQLTVFCRLQPLICLQCAHIMHSDINHNDKDTHDNHLSSLSFSGSQQAGAVRKHQAFSFISEVCIGVQKESLKPTYFWKNSPSPDSTHLAWMPTKPQFSRSNKASFHHVSPNHDRKLVNAPKLPLQSPHLI